MGHTAIQIAAGTHADHLAYAGPAAEITYDETQKRLVVQDGSTAGGIPHARLDELPSFQSGFVNKLINGDFAIDQVNEGTAYTVSGGSQQNIVDGWRGLALGSGTFTAQRVALPFVTGLTEPFENCLKCVVGTADTSVTGTDFYQISQIVLGQDLRGIGLGSSISKSLIFTGWVASQVTGTYGVVVKNYNGTRSFAGQVTIAAANTWTQISIPVPPETAASWDFSSAPSMIVSFALATGSSWQITPGTWQNVNAGNSSGGTALFMGTSGNSLWLTGFDLRVGSVGGFERVRAEEMLHICRGRFQKSWAAGTPVASVTDLGAERYVSAASATTDWYSVALRRSLVAAPVVTLYSSNSGATAKVYSVGTSADVAATASNPSDRGFMPNFAASATGGYRFHWTVDARPS